MTYCGTCTGVGTGQGTGTGTLHGAHDGAGSGVGGGQDEPQALNKKVTYLSIYNNSKIIFT